MNTERRERLEIILSPEQLDYVFTDLDHDHDLMLIIWAITDDLIECEADYTNVRDQLEELKGGTWTYDQPDGEPRLMIP